MVREKNLTVSKKAPNQTHAQELQYLGLSRFVFQKKLNHLKKKLYFIVNDFNHKILSNKNKILRLSNELYSLKLASSQRQTGLKFQIDHDYSWKTFYGSRKKANEIKMSSAHRDLKPALSDLIRFDAERTLWYQGTALASWKSLIETQKRDARNISSVKDKIGKLETEVVEWNLKKHTEASEKIGLIKRFQKDLIVTQQRITSENAVDRLRESDLMSKLREVISKDPSLKSMQSIDDLVATNQDPFSSLNSLMLAQNATAKSARRAKAKASKKAADAQAKKLKQEAKLQKKKQAKLKATLIAKRKAYKKRQQLKAKKGKIFFLTTNSNC